VSATARPDPRVMVAQARAAVARGERGPALAILTRAAEAFPRLSALQVEFGNLAFAQGDRAAAEAAYLRAIAADPRDFAALIGLGNALRERGEASEAIARYRQATVIAPTVDIGWYNLGLALREVGLFDEAIAAYDRALAIDPRKPACWYNRGNALTGTTRFADAIASYDEALRLRPDYIEAVYSKSMALLLNGDLAQGWDLYEARWRSRLSSSTPRFATLPQWEGQPLEGKRLLVWGEQGIGDEILFAGIYREVAAMAGRCLIECTAKLLPLIARSVPGASLAARTTPPQACKRGGFDYQAPAGDLARWLRPALASFPRHDGYLVPPDGRVAYWKERLAALGPGPWIGFGWRSSNLKGPRAAADIKLDLWGPVFTTPGAGFVCLQYGECTADLAQARERWGVPLHAFPEVDLFNDLDEAAALTKAVDLVISAPTAVSILAAALGVPTWQLAFGYDWQRHGTPRNPWFPAMTIFHRDVDQQWDEILLDVARELRRWVRGAGHAPRHRDQDRDLRPERPATD